MTSFARRSLRFLARPMRESVGGEGLAIDCYRGFGTRQEFYLLGRVWRQPGENRAGPEVGDLRASLKRLFRRGARDRTVTACYGGAEQRVITDRNGYFQVHLSLLEPAPEDTRWHFVTLRLELPSHATVTAQGEVYVPPQSARVVVVSDIDDTVMFTGVASKLKMFWRLFAQGARSRLAFPGVGELYRALHGPEQNPILYVSRGPWTIYSMLEAFFQRHRIPVGPVLFLRDWGVSLRRPLPRQATEHKQKLIRQILDLYHDLPFVLIGDSGQHDPETYARIVQEHPGRVRAIYIRNVSRGIGRAKAIHELAEEVVGAGSSLVLATDTVAIAEHAAELGLVAPDTPRRVAEERRIDGEAGPVHPRRHLRRATRKEIREAVEHGELDRALNEDETPSAIVEAEQDRDHNRP